MRLEEIYKKYGQTFALYVYNHMANKGMSEDVVQDVFVILCMKDNKKKIESMAEDEAIRYVYKCLSNRIVDCNRKNESTSFPYRYNNRKRDFLSVEESAEETAVRKQSMMETLKKVKDAIGEEDFLLLIDIFYIGIPQRPMAKKLGMTENTLNGKVHRIKKRIKKYFNGNK